MSDGLVCDGCGEPLLLDSDVRYVLEIKGYAAYDPLEITFGELERTDWEAEMARLVDAMKGRDPADLEAEVHREFRFDLCPKCWKRYQRDPLAGLRPPPSGGSSQSGGAPDADHNTPGEGKKSQGN